MPLLLLLTLLTYVHGHLLQKDVLLVTPPPAVAKEPFRDWPFGNSSWPWKGKFNLDPYYGGSGLAAMARLIYIGRSLAKEGSTTAGAAADKVAGALKLLLQKRLASKCAFQAGFYEGGPLDGRPGTLCYDSVFKLVTTSRAQGVSCCWLNPG